jgi:hypothetical protein
MATRLAAVEQPRSSIERLMSSKRTVDETVVSSVR